MRVSTSTNQHYSFVGDQGKPHSAEESVRELAKAGFTVLDFNFDAFSVNKLWLNDPDWEDRVRRVKDYSDALGIEWSQSHAFFYGWDGDRCGSHERGRELIRRSIAGAGILGCRTITVHPFQVTDGIWYSHKLSLENNLAEMRRYGEWASAAGLKVAIENMIEYHDKPRRYCSSSEELIELIDALGDDSLYGATLDTGHANITGINQAEAIKALGKRLVALHVNDNRGLKDDHLAPFYGTIDWPSVMGALKAIDYRGDFTFEIHRHTDCLPAGLHENLFKFTHDLGEYLVGLAN